MSGGTYPTSRWGVGEIVRDDHTLVIPCDLQPGDYRIELGMYDYPSLERIGFVNSEGKSLGDQLILDDPIKVSP